MASGSSSRRAPQVLTPVAARPLASTAEVTVNVGWITKMQEEFIKDKNSRALITDVSWIVKIHVPSAKDEMYELKLTCDANYPDKGPYMSWPRSSLKRGRQHKRDLNGCIRSIKHKWHPGKKLIEVVDDVKEQVAKGVDGGVGAAHGRK